MRPSQLEGHRYLILVLILLAPSVWFASEYAVNSSSGDRTVNSIATTPGPDWNVTMSVENPSYFLTGQQVPVNLLITVAILNPNVTIGLNTLSVELREPLKVNPTTGVVETWRTLSSSQGGIFSNYTTSSTVSKVVEVTGTYPPSANPIDSFTPSSRLALNGVLNYTVFQASENVTSASPQLISLVDDQAFYRTQLSTVESVSSWISYQLSTALLVSLIYIRTRPREIGTAERTYALGLDSYKIERTLAHLGELRNSGRLSDTKYGELKKDHSKD